MKRLMSIGLAAALSMAVVHAADAPSPDDVAKKSIETRQGLLKVIGFANTPIGGMLRNPATLDTAVVEKSAARIAVLGGMLPEVFANDTRKFTGVKTQALDGIWNSLPDFKLKADDLVKAATELETVAKGGDKDATRKAAMALGKACSGCHDSYKFKAT